MPRVVARFSVFFAFSLLVCFSLLALASTGSAGDRSKKPKKEAVSVTGCLEKGSEHDGYYINDGNRMWELSGKPEELSKHVGHRVTVTGVEEKRSKSDEKRMAEKEKGESAGKDVRDLKVKSLEHLSETCGGGQ